VVGSLRGLGRLPSGLVTREWLHEIGSRHRSARAHQKKSCLDGPRPPTLVESKDRHGQAQGVRTQMDIWSAPSMHPRTLSLPPHLSLRRYSGQAVHAHKGSSPTTHPHAASPSPHQSWRRSGDIKDVLRSSSRMSRSSVCVRVSPEGCPCSSLV